MIPKKNGKIVVEWISCIRSIIFRWKLVEIADRENGDRENGG